jgi:hypothetical protein
VYGVRTEETMADRALINRYDYDGIFGTGEPLLQCLHALPASAALLQSGQDDSSCCCVRVL